MAIEFTKTERVRPYESVIVVDPSASDEQRKKIFQKNKQVIESFHGEVHKVETWGKRKLANPINKLKTAEFFHSYFTANPDAILEIERTLKINDNVLRVIHTKLDETVPVEKHVEKFKEILKESQERLNEADARKQKKREFKPRK